MKFKDLPVGAIFVQSVCFGECRYRKTAEAETNPNAELVDSTGGKNIYFPPDYELNSSLNESLVSS